MVFDPYLWHVDIVKTTLELPATLLRRVKAAAALQGRSMKDLITEALEEHLTERPGKGGWRAVFGRASKADVRDVDRRIKVLERIDPKEWE